MFVKTNENKHCSKLLSHFIPAYLNEHIANAYIPERWEHILIKPNIKGCFSITIEITSTVFLAFSKLQAFIIYKVYFIRTAKPPIQMKDLHNFHRNELYVFFTKAMAWSFKTCSWYFLWILWHCSSSFFRDFLRCSISSFVSSGSYLKEV